MTRSKAGVGYCILAPLLALVTICGCHAKPSTSVLATVNGQDVTQGDVASALTASPYLEGLSSPARERAALEGLVDGKLLAQQAKRQGLDASAAYAAARQRLQDADLAQQVVMALAAQAPSPTRPQVQAFIAANPQMFSQRRLYILDQVRTTAAGMEVGALGRLHSMSAVEAYLHAQGRPYRYGSIALDTSKLPALDAKKVAELAPGEPLVSQHGPVFTISTVQDSEPAPLSEAQQWAQAARTLRRTVLQQLVRERLAQLRSGARISYLTGSSTMAAAPRTSALEALPQS